MAADATAVLSSHRSIDSKLDERAVSTVSPPMLWIGPVILGLLGLAYAACLMQGMRLFDNDFDWIAWSSVNWWKILRQIFSPLQTDWGFQHRPVQLLCFKTLFGLAGYTAWPYYAFKAALLAGAVAAVALFGAVSGLSLVVSIVGASLFALSTPVFESALWVSDFELLAQIFLLAALGCFLHIEGSDLWNRSRSKFYQFQGLVFLFALLGHRTKGSVKLLPAILLGYLLLFHRKAILRHAPMLLLIIVTIVPVFGLLSDPVPPFVPFSEDRSQGWMWKPANLETLQLLLVGNVHWLKGTTGLWPVHSLFGAIGPILLWCTVGASVLLIVRKAVHHLPSSTLASIRLCSVWLAVVICSFSAFPRLPHEFMGRYLVGALIPASLLIAYVAGRGLQVTGVLPRWIRAVLAGIVILHGALSFQHTRQSRESLGQIMVVTDRARDSISRTVSNANVILLGFPFSYNRSTSNGNRYVSENDQLENPFHPTYALVQHDGSVANANYRIPARRLASHLSNVLGEAGEVKVDLRHIQTYNGLTDSLYDRYIYGSARSLLGVLFQVHLTPLNNEKGIVR